MFGAIAGDIIGSIFEIKGTKSKDFPLFVPESSITDDTVLTLAIADKILHGGSYIDLYQEWFFSYDWAGFGGRFMNWCVTRSREPYQSPGNGAAMKVSPIAWAFDTLEEVRGEAVRSAEVTHNSPEGLKGAESVASAIFLARKGYSKEVIKGYIEQEFHYDLSARLDDIRPDYDFSVNSQRSVPESIISFLESTDYEDALRNAISLGGDADTMACIAGGIAEAFYGPVPENIRVPALSYMDDRMKKILFEFEAKYVRTK
jgi:ADP-ribosylglycohydrolase